MRRWMWVALLGALAILMAVGCGGGEEVILATTTSTYDSGLLDALVPDFEDQTDYEVKIIAVGTGQALAMGERGDAGQRAHYRRGPLLGRTGIDDRLSGWGCYGAHHCGTEPAGYLCPIDHLWRVTGASGERTPAGRLWFRGQLCRPVRSVGWWYLYQGGRHRG